jgi:hypothetical protein
MFCSCKQYRLWLSIGLQRTASRGKIPIVILSFKLSGNRKIFLCFTGSTNRYFSPLLVVQIETMAEQPSFCSVVKAQGFRDRSLRLYTHVHLGPRVKASKAARPLPMRKRENLKFSISRHSLLNYISKHALLVSSQTL